MTGRSNALAEREVLLAAAGSDVHDPGPLVVGHLVPRDDAVRRRPAAAGSSSNGPVVRQAPPARRPGASRTTSASPRDARLRAGAHPPPAPVRALDQLVGQPGMDRGGHVARQRPRRRGPDQQVLALVAGLVIGRRRVDRQVPDLAVALGRLHVRDAGPAARAPRHHVVAPVDQAAAWHSARNAQIV